MASLRVQLGAVVVQLVLAVGLLPAGEAGPRAAQLPGPPGSAASRSDSPPAAASPPGATAGSALPPETPVAGRIAAAPPAPSPVEATEPPIYYLKDRDGNLVPVPGFSLEEFEELYRLKNRLGQPDPRPRHSLQSVTVAGTADEDRAELDIQAKFVVRDASWVRIPLRFDRAMMTEAWRHEGEGECFVQADDAGEGYVAWVRATPATEHTVTFRAVSPVAVSGAQHRLRLTFPRATTGEIRLRVPQPGIAAKVSEGATLLPPVTSPDATEIRAVVLGGEVELAWRPADQPIQEAAPVLEVAGAQAIRLDASGVETQAVLTLSSQAGPFSSFQVRLPGGTALEPDATSGYRVAVVEPAQEGASGGPLVEVRLVEPTRGPVEVRLRARRTAAAAGPEGWIELAGFEVPGAVRQWGHMAVAAPSDWQVLWGPSRAVRQVEQVPENLRREDVVACFEYAGQPCSLTARLAPRGTRLSLEPEYVLLVDTQQVELRARLKYTIRGAKVHALSVEMGDWETTPDDVGPDNLVAASGVVLDDKKRLTIPLIQPTSGPMEIQLVARRPIRPDGEVVELSLPRPQSNTSSSALVVVVPNDNVELAPVAASIRSLVRQQSVDSVELPRRRQPPLFYRGAIDQAVFAARIRARQREVSASLSGRLILDESGGRLEQTIAYTIAYEPIDHLMLEAPRELAGSDLLTIEHEGEPLRPLPSEDVVAAPGVAESGAAVRFRIALSQPIVGPYELRVAFPLGPIGLSSRAAQMLDVPLVLPADAAIVEHRLMVSTPSSLRATVATEGWTLDEPVDASPATESHLRATTEPRKPLRLRLERLTSGRDGGPVIDRAWIQTWLSYSARQDRAVFRWRAAGGHFRVTLPEGAAAHQAMVLLDGRRTAARLEEGSRLVIRLPDEAAPAEHVLEIRYHFPGPRAPRGAFALELPRLDDGVWVRRSYWQLVLPQDEHVVVAPESCTSEFTWGWSDYFWGRRPLLEQFELETWSGALHLASVPLGTNRYLYSAFGPINTAELRTAGRAWIVLFASGWVLIVGLVLIYVPAARHPALLVVLAMALMGVYAVWPVAALLVAQAALLGLGLALLAAALQWGLGRAARAAAAPPPPQTTAAALSAAGAAAAGSAGSDTTKTRLPQDAVPPEPRAAEPALGSTAPPSPESP